MQGNSPGNKASMQSLWVGWLLKGKGSEKDLEVPGIIVSTWVLSAMLFAVAKRLLWTLALKKKKKRKCNKNQHKSRELLSLLYQYCCLNCFMSSLLAPCEITEKSKSGSWKINKNFSLVQLFRSGVWVACCSVWQDLHMKKASDHAVQKDIGYLERQKKTFSCEIWELDKFNLEIRCSFLAVIKHLNGLPEEVVDWL